MAQKIRKPDSPQSAGGKATAIILRKKALDAYYKNPSICKQCSKIITVQDDQKVPATKKKKFCNQSCSASYNNSKRTSKIEFKKEEKMKLKILKKEQKKFIDKFNCLKNISKKEMFDKCLNYQSARTRIQKHARYVYSTSNKPKCCSECGYDKHYEVCHIKPVSKFNDESLIIEDINNVNNLISLCPTHHWEFDNGILEIKSLQ